MFELIFLLRITGLLSKSGFVTKFACDSSMIMISKFLFNFTKFCVIIILFSVAVSAEFAANPLMLGILPSISIILAL